MSIITVVLHLLSEDCICNKNQLLCQKWHLVEYYDMHDANYTSMIYALHIRAKDYCIHLNHRYTQVLVAYPESQIFSEYSEMSCNLCIEKIMLTLLDRPSSIIFFLLVYKTFMSLEHGAKSSMQQTTRKYFVLLEYKTTSVMLLNDSHDFFFYTDSTITLVPINISQLTRLRHRYYI